MLLDTSFLRVWRLDHRFSFLQFVDKPVVFAGSVASPDGSSNLSATPFQLFSSSRHFPNSLIIETRHIITSLSHAFVDVLHPFNPPFELTSTFSASRTWWRPRPYAILRIITLPIIKENGKLESLVRAQGHAYGEHYRRSFRPGHPLHLSCKSRRLNDQPQLLNCWNSSHGSLYSSHPSSRRLKALSPHTTGLDWYSISSSWLASSLWWPPIQSKPIMSQLSVISPAVWFSPHQLSITRSIQIPPLIKLLRRATFS